MTQIKDDAELKLVADRVSADLQAIQSYLGDRNCEDGKIAFPWGYIRAASVHRQKYWFLRSETLRRNVGYALIGTDVFRWLINRTRIKGAAREMIIKESICLLGAMCESITKDVLGSRLGKKKTYKKRTAALAHRGIIDADLHDDLNWLWDQRNNEHLFLLEDRELGKYALPDLNRAILIVHALRTQLHEAFIANRMD